MLRSKFNSKDVKAYSRTLKKGAAYAFAVLLWLLLWLFAAKRINIELILPTPSAVFKALLKLGASDTFWRAVLTSMLRVLGGFAVGVLGGAVVAALAYLVSAVKIFLAPMIKVVRATPVASFILIAVLWLPSNTVPAFIAFLMVFPIVYGNVFKALEETDVQLSEMTVMYGFGLIKKLRYLYIPTMIPYLLAACTTSLGLAWKSGIAAEVLCVTKESIGQGLYLSNIYLETADLFAWTVTVVIMSVLLERLTLFVVGIMKNVRRKRYGAGDQSREAV